MSGTLTKKLIQSAVSYPATPGTPGYPGNSATAGYYTYACRQVSTQPTKIVSSILISSNREITFEVPYGPAVLSTVCGTTWVPAQPARNPIPAVAGTSARSSVLTNLGWTGGGRSTDIMVEGGTFLFTVPQAVAVVVGLVDLDQSTSPNEALHAFYIYRGVISIRERGVDVFSSPAYPHLAANIYGISRSGNTISYLINGAVIYSSLSKSSLPLALDASLYTAGDTVVLAPFSPLSNATIDGYFEPLSGLLGRTSYAQIDGRFGVLSGDLLSRPRGTLDGSFTALIGLLGPLSYAQIDASFEPLAGGLESVGMLLDINVIDGEFLPLLGSLVNSANVSGFLDGYFAPLQARLAVGGYSEIDASFGSLTASLQIPADANEIVLFSGMAVIDDVALSSLLTISFTSGFAVLSTTTANELLTMEMQSALASGMEATLHSLHTMALTSGVGLTSSNAANSYVGGQRSATAWVTNLDTGAVSMYAGFDFDRMYELDGKYYGVRDNSTYLLDGATDNGAPIDAFVAFGKQTFGTSALKHVPNFYAGVSSTGVLLLRVSTGSETYTYSPRRIDAISKTQRYDLGKGLRASYYEFELFNQAGCDFELDTVEFLALPSGRRI